MKKLGLIVAAAAMIATVSATVVSAKGWVQQGADWYYVDGSGEYVTESIQSSGTNKFYLGEDGRMMKDYFLEEKDNQAYYFGSNGAMVTNTWVAIDSSIVESQGDYVPDTYWYYFQASGKAMKAASGSVKKTTIDGKKVAFNEHGQMLTGWFKDSGEIVNPDDDANPFSDALYYAGGDNDGVLRSGWVTYYDGYDDPNADGIYEDKTNLYFYFNTTNNKKETTKTKTINGKKYAFDDKGIMLSGWDVVKANDGSDQQGVIIPDSLNDKIVYFSGEDDGHQVKKGWVYAVPAQSIDSEAYNDDEEKYMYFGSSGEIVADQFKKVNGKWYVFNGNGIMKTGLILWNTHKNDNTGAYTATGSYITKFDMDYAEGSDLIKKGWVRTGSADTDWVKLSTASIILSGNADYSGAEVKLHYFGEDGARRTGNNAVQFSDDTYTFYSTSGGDKGTGQVGKKYYSFGILLKANSDIRYGLYACNKGEKYVYTKVNNDDWTSFFIGGSATRSFIVLNTSGAKVKYSKSAKKDADGNYWLIGGSDSDGYFKGIYSVNVKYEPNKKSYDYNSEGRKEYGSDDKLITHDYTGKYWYQSDVGDKTNVWIPFGCKNAMGKTEKDYRVTPNNDYFLNCYWSD